jgi:DNA-binding MarR family transcriptional regulator
VKANDLPETKQPYQPDDRTRRIAAVLDAMDELVQQMSEGHTAEFLEIGITMPQAKTLYLVATVNEIRMSVLATRLGVTLSTVSGLVDRLADAGFVSRHDDPADRRQVVVAITSEGARLLERFRELSRRQLGDLIGGLTDRDLVTVSHATTILARAAERLSRQRTTTGAEHSTDPAARPPAKRARSAPDARQNTPASAAHPAERNRS